MSRSRIALCVLLLAWCCAVLFWAWEPIHDAVPTGLVNNQQSTQTIRCNSPLSSTPGPDGALPALPEGRAYARTPCVGAHDEYRWLFGVDVIVALAAVAALVVLRRRGEERNEVNTAAAAA